LHIRDLYARPQPAISFEFFPPKDAAAEAVLFSDTVPALKKLGPSFISVTYGAGGSTRGTTLRVVNRVRRDHGLDAVAHLTCVGSTREMLLGVLEEARSLDIHDVLALRGDPPKDQKTFEPVAGGFRYAIDLIHFVKGIGGFGIGAACYPEGHVECGDKQLDWDRAADKVEAGAEFLITQLFYDWNDFLAMEDYLRNRRQVKVPIIPGVLPFLNTSQIKRFTSLCGSKLPADLLQKLEQFASEDESVRQLGVEVCTAICQKALAHGVRGLHFYCLNRVPSSAAIMANLGLVP